jgi:transcription initiation factor TFIID subunit 11
MELPSRHVHFKEGEENEEEEKKEPQDGDEGEQEEKAQSQMIDDEEAMQKFQIEQQKYYSLLLDSFTPQQREQHDKYRIAKLDLQEVRKIMLAVTGVTTNPSKKVLTVMAGVAKVFVGQIIEEARKLCKPHEMDSPLEPRHIRAALRKLRASGQDPSMPSVCAPVVGRRTSALWR